MSQSDRLVSLRRALHRKPEVAWTEFYTTARIIDELNEIGVDSLHIGPDALDGEKRMCVPDEDTLARAFDRAREEGANPDTLSKLEGGYTGAVAVLEKGEGPTIALRVDIDGLPQRESAEASHVPASEGFRSEHEGEMHACGHDAHATIGLGVLERIKESDFQGTFKLLFQPAEEVVGGGRAMAESGHLDDVDYLLAIHVGLDHPTGEIVAGIDGFLAVTQFRATFTGHPGHAGAAPEEGKNAVQAMAAAVQNLYGISRHSDGETRINTGKVGGGTAVNIIPEEAFIHGEVRGKTSELRDYMWTRAQEVLDGAATMHGCDLALTIEGEAPSATSDEALVDIVYDRSEGIDGVTSRMRRDDLGGSEDATFLMQYVQDRGGLAAYVGVGTSHPSGHHTATFDVEEETLDIGVETVTSAILDIAEKQP